MSHTEHIQWIISLFAVWAEKTKRSADLHTTEKKMAICFRAMEKARVKSGVEFLQASVLVGDNRLSENFEAIHAFIADLENIRWFTQADRERFWHLRQYVRSKVAEKRVNKIPVTTKNICKQPKIYAQLSKKLDEEKLTAELVENKLAALFEAQKSLVKV
jgi:hypothetical protein